MPAGGIRDVTSLGTIVRRDAARNSRVTPDDRGSTAAEPFALEHEAERNRNELQRLQLLAIDELLFRVDVVQLGFDEC